MQSFIRTFSGTVLAVAALTAGAGAQAQGSSPATGGSGYSWYAPGATYIGFNAGKSDYSLSSGAGAFPSDNRHTAYNIYGGGYFNNYVGLELGYANFGKINRAGGTTKAEGINLSLVGKLPLNNSFNLQGRLGTTYGRTNVSSVPVSGIVSGSESGFGLSYGLGAEYAFDPNWSAVLQWDRYALKFPGSGRDRVSATTVGLRYRF
jgi:opacity protein-like surface antigen